MENNCSSFYCMQVSLCVYFCDSLEWSVLNALGKMLWLVCNESRRVQSSAAPHDLPVLSLSHSPNMTGNLSVQSPMWSTFLSGPEPWSRTGWTDVISVPALPFLSFTSWMLTFAHLKNGESSSPLADLVKSQIRKRMEDNQHHHHSNHRAGIIAF